MGVCPAREPLPVPFKAFPKPQHQFILPHPSSLIVSEDVVPASEFSIQEGKQKTVTAKSGQKKVTLTCGALNKNIIVVEWSRADLGDKYVLVYRDGHFLPDDQHPSFKDRVDLQDRQMKDGDVSLILKDVTINDAGTYECRVQRDGEDMKLVSIIYLRVDPPDQKTITAESGQNVTLTCRAPQGKPIRAVKWSRADLGDKYVLLYQDEQFDQTSQHPSFKNRVDLQDRQMKDGDVSLILKDVTVNDAGTYECRVIVGDSASLEIMGTVNMSVLPPGHTGGDKQDGPVGLIVGLSVSAVLLVAVVGFLIYRKHKQAQSKDPYQPPAETQPV
ncbi:CD226 antigen-like [Simochromis diagramma]|uniref:CD226 antigen-like n=1 Tax=Simochromis diagramma TaxID=43689 RepID=UPI001A7E35A6|nr:CD226 antigen-like [Simochromis diagramma]